MKIIQSLWTKPYSDKKLEKTKTFYELSSKLLYDAGLEVDLYTDQAGLKLFSSSKYYKNIYPILNNIDYFSEHLWSVAKIFSMLQVNEPLVHIDGDIFFRNPSFIKNILAKDWDALVQSQEITEHWYYFYDKSLDIFNSLFKFENPFLANILKQYNYTYNVGVFGFKDFAVFKAYATMFFKLANNLNQNVESIQKYNNLKDSRPWVRGAKVNINCIIEQVQFTFFAKYHNLYVKELLPLDTWDDFEWQFFQNFNHNFGYEHLAGPEKYEDTELYEKILKEIASNSYQEEEKSKWKNY